MSEKEEEASSSAAGCCFSAEGEPEAIEEEVVVEAAAEEEAPVEVTTVEQDALQQAHVELKKKEGSVSLGKALARTFSSTGMTKGDVKRAEEYAKKIKESPEADDAAAAEEEAAEEEADAPAKEGDGKSPAGLLLRGGIVVAVAGVLLKGVFGGAAEAVAVAVPVEKKKTFFGLIR